MARQSAAFLVLLMPLVAAINATVDAPGAGADQFLPKRPSEVDNSTVAEEQSSLCLCLFDIDRTLTAHQGSGWQCPGNQDQQGVGDSAYGGGMLTLSQLGASGVSSTFCARCYLGIVSAGVASGDGSAERAVLLSKALVNSLQTQLASRQPKSSSWSSVNAVDSPLVVGVAEGQKQRAAFGILNWYKSQGLTIASSNTFFFDDKAVNVQNFQGSGINAHQVSCASRDWYEGGVIGYCGARLSEIVSSPGVTLC